MAHPILLRIVASSCFAAAIWIVTCTRIGPVIATLTATHGIHLGDLTAVALGVVGLFAAYRSR